MFLEYCPGSEKFRQPKPEEINCPHCGEVVEIWSDEVFASCPGCKNIVFRMQEATCLEWCKYARECVGEKNYKKYMENRALTVKERLLKELEEYFGEDKKRIAHAKMVLDFAEEILKIEKGDWHIVIPAAILHDVGIKVAGEKYAADSGDIQGKKGAEIARKILQKMGFKREDIEQICEIIAHHHSPREEEGLNFRILYDADLLVNLKDELNLDNKEKLKEKIEKIFLTPTGRVIAQRIYLR
ncbi:MAG: HD domain-containing protein [Candidatus Omnitrophica bacterium]|nr:HD domain-containing protein [Candidatus Omnitrophota bacterium]MCM8793243.1 HD domain-containing protein [Candidatus Omnitrophota bacterium]